MTNLKDLDLIVLSVPHRGEPSAYRIDAESFCRSVEDAAGERGQDAFYSTTPRQLLSDWSGATPESTPDEDADDGWIRDLGAAHGWDTPIYRADAILGEGVYTAEPVDRLAAAEAYEVSDLSALYVLKSETEARDLIARLLSEDAPRIGQCGPQRAAWALERLLDALAA